MILNYCKQRIALLLAGSISNTNLNEYPNYIMIGTGSSTMASGNTTLTTPQIRKAVTSTTNTPYKISWQGDWSSVEMSGLSFKEFGMIGSAANLTGSLWSELVLPSVNFDGTNELRIVENWEVF